MAIDLIREAVKNAYRSRKWTNKVNNMSDSQLVAIYHRLQQQKVI